MSKEVRRGRKCSLITRLIIPKKGASPPWERVPQRLENLGLGDQIPPSKGEAANELGGSHPHQKVWISSRSPSLTPTPK